jgi:hypothetical protein
MSSNKDIEMMLWGAACMPNERDRIMEIPSEYLSDEMVQRLKLLSKTIEERKVAHDLNSWFLDRRVSFSNKNNALFDSVADALKRDYERNKMVNFAGELQYSVKIGDRNQLVKMMKDLLRDLGEIE